MQLRRGPIAPAKLCEARMRSALIRDGTDWRDGLLSRWPQVPSCRLDGYMPATGPIAPMKDTFDAQYECHWIVVLICGAASPGTNCPDQGKMRTCARAIYWQRVLSARVFAIKVFNGAGHTLWAFFRCTGTSMSLRCQLALWCKRQKNIVQHIGLSLECCHVECCECCCHIWLSLNCHIELSHWIVTLDCQWHGIVNWKL